MTELNEHGKALRQAAAELTALLVLPQPTEAWIKAVDVAIAKARGESQVLAIDLLNDAPLPSNR